MGLKQRNISARSIRHAVQSSKEHAEDVAANVDRQQTSWIAIDVPKSDGHHHIESLGAGFNYICNGKGSSVEAVNGDAFIEHMDKQRQERSYYYRPIKDPKASGGIRWKHTPCSISQWGVPLAPWFSEHAYELARTGREGKFIEFSAKLAQQVKNDFEKLTGREVLAVSVHTDTRNLHCHVFHSRCRLADHKYYEDSTKALFTIGDWASAVLRQKRFGVIDPASKNAKGAETYRKIIKNRHGVEPVDATIWESVDRLCISEFGACTTGLASYKKEFPLQQVLRLIAAMLGIQKEIRLLQKLLNITDEDLRNMVSDAKGGGDDADISSVAPPVEPVKVTPNNFVKGMVYQPSQFDPAPIPGMSLS